MSCDPSTDAKHLRNPRYSLAVLRLIGGFKFMEGILVLAVIVGEFHLLHRDIARVLSEWAAVIRVDPNNTHIHWVLAKMGVLDDHRLKQIIAGSFVYTGLRLVEGVGLFLGKKWAEYLVVIVTGILIPVEIYELWVSASPLKVAVLLINGLVLWYLAVQLWRSFERPPQG